MLSLLKQVWNQHIAHHSISQIHATPTSIKNESRQNDTPEGISTEVSNTTSSMPVNNNGNSSYQL